MRPVRIASLAALALIATSAGSIAGAGQDTKVGFGVRRITPVTRAGETGWPPAEWSRYFTPHAVTGVWGEPYEDLDGNGCLSGLNNYNLEPVTRGSPPRGQTPEPHTDQPWNSAGDGAMVPGPWSVRGVDIYGDPQSTGKWDGVWANAGFGSRCTEGAKDDTWARAVVIERGDDAVALVSLDVVGLFNIEVRRVRKEMAARYPDMGVDEIVISSTHTHEGVDTMGFWGQLYLSIDGKFPAYQAFIRSQIIDAVHEAWSARRDAQAIYARTEFLTAVRDSRPPVIKDPWLYAARFVDRSGDTIGTLTNWSNHPEAQGSGNPLVSSDFPHGVRERLEQVYDAPSVYFSGSVGGLMTPLGQNVPGHGTQVSWARTYALGHQVADAAVAALEGTDPSADRLGPVDIDTLNIARREFYLTVDNGLLRGLNMAGIFDIPTYNGGDKWGDASQHREGVYAGFWGSDALTEMVAVDLGDALFLSVPGELSPELEIGWPDPSNPRPDCPSANTGRPLERPIDDSFDQPFSFVLGLGQDELGYIIPGYDFWITSVGQDSGGSGVVPVGGVEHRTCGEGHYEETVSGGSTFAPWVTCVAAELAGRDPWDEDAACSYDNTHTLPYGVHAP